MQPRPATSTPCALVRALPHAAWLVSLPDAVVVAANGAASRLLGRPVHELVGAPAQQLAASPEDLAWWAAAAEGDWQAAAKAGSGRGVPALDSDAVFAAADGRVHHVRRSISVVFDEGEPDPVPERPADATARRAWALVVVVDRTPEQAADDEREARLAELEATLESTADGLLVTDLAGRLRSFNRRFATLWGLPEELLRARNDAAIGAWMQRSVLDPHAYAARLQALLEAPLLAASDRITLLGGSVFERVTRPLWRDGRPQGRVWSFRDLSERLAAEERIETLASTDALTGLPNRATMSGWVEAAARSLTPSHRKAQAAGHAGAPIAAGDGARNGSGVAPRSADETGTAPGRGSGPEGRCQGGREDGHGGDHGGGHEIDHRGGHEGAVAAAKAASPGERTAGFAVLVVDLDRFRQINASLGHAMGDRVLRHVAQRLQGCLREEDRLARIGGDQFGVLLRGADARAAETTARRMLNVVAQPCSLEGATFTLTCSIGIALAPSHGRSADELARHAEAAMRAVKLSGRGNVRLHQMRAEVDRRSHMTLDHAMRQALVSGRFRLAYQPQVGLADGRIVGAEALLRWRDPELGEVSPGRFIPVAEETGFIVAIGDWVLAQAVRQAALWQQRGLAVPVAVNVSALQFHQAQFVERVASVLAVSALPPHLLELELTESILVHDADEALARLRALERLGVRMSIDDFGTGYSSLAYLKRFPIGKLKIDRSFVQGLPADETDAGIVRAILQMAQALDMRVIAEGVETEQQREFLVREGCAEMQGFLYAPALDPLSFEERLTQAAATAPGGADAPAGDGRGTGPGGKAHRFRLVRG